MANGSDWITKGMLATAICTLAALAVGFNYTLDYRSDCASADERISIRNHNDKKFTEIGNKLDDAVEKSTQQVQKIRDEIREEVTIMRQNQREDMKEIKELIKDKNGK